MPRREKPKSLPFSPMVHFHWNEVMKKGLSDGAIRMYVCLHLDLMQSDGKAVWEESRMRNVTGMTPRTMRKHRSELEISKLLRVRGEAYMTESVELGSTYMKDGSPLADGVSDRIGAIEFMDIVEYD